MIEYVRRKMYFELVKSKSKDEDDSVEDSECEEAVDELEDDVEENNDDDEANIEVSKNEEFDQEKDVVDNDPKDPNHNEEETSHTSSNESDIVSIPVDYVFPSYFVFIDFGPFVEPDLRLSLVSIDN